MLTYKQLEFVYSLLELEARVTVMFSNESQPERIERDNEPLSW